MGPQSTVSRESNSILLDIMLLFVAFATFVASTYAGNFTVTDECWFDIESTDYDGPGEHYNGRFVIGVMGETAPMTALNFVSLTRGHKQGKNTLSQKATVPVPRAYTARSSATRNSSYP